jgi:hypothetical protein
MERRYRFTPRDHLSRIAWLNYITVTPAVDNQLPGQPLRVTVSPQGFWRKAHRRKKLVSVELTAAAGLSGIKKQLDHSLSITRCHAPKQVCITLPLCDHFDRLVDEQTAWRRGQVLMD